MKIDGKIKLINDTQSFGSNGFQKREFVVATEEQYSQDILLEFHQDKCSILDKYKVGQNVAVSINIRGKEWTNPQGEVKYFNSLVAWRIEKLEGSTQAAPPPFEPADGDMPQEDENSDLPF